MPNTEDKLLSDGEKTYLKSMDVGEHVTVWCPNLDIKQNEIVKTEDGWEVYTGFGRIKLDWETIEKDVERVI